MRTFVLNSTRGGTWTRTIFRSADFKSAVSAYSTTRAYEAARGTWTPDLVFTKHLRYQLRYDGIKNAAYTFDYINRSLYKNWVFFLLWTIH